MRRRPVEAPVLNGLGEVRGHDALLLGEIDVQVDPIEPRA